MFTETFITHLRETDEEAAYKRLDEKINKRVGGNLRVNKIHNLVILKTENDILLSRCVDFDEI